MLNRVETILQYERKQWAATSMARKKISDDSLCFFFFPFLDEKQWRIDKKHRLKYSSLPWASFPKLQPGTKMSLCIAYWPGLTQIWDGYINQPFFQFFSPFIADILTIYGYFCDIADKSVPHQLPFHLKFWSWNGPQKHLAQLAATQSVQAFKGMHLFCSPIHASKVHAMGASLLK